MTRTIVRLAFELAPEAHSELGSIVRERGLPLLAKHGFAAVEEAGRTTVPDVCASLFAVDKVSELADQREALPSDESWRQLLQELGNRFGRAGSDSMVEYRVELYSALAGPGKPQPTNAGCGLRHRRMLLIDLTSYLLPFAVNCFLVHQCRRK